VSGSCRAPDGSPCNNDNECLSNDCTPFYADDDGDGFGAASSGTRKVCGSTAPAGAWVNNNDDCCDLDPEANPDYSGGPRDYGVSGCTRPFDWNCDGEEKPNTPIPPDPSVGCPFYTTAETCPSLVITAPTACGEQGPSAACGWTGEECSNQRGVLWTQTCD